MRSHFSVSVLAMLLLAACGGDDEKSGAGDPIDNPAATQSALSAFDATAKLKALSADNADDQSALGGIGGLFGSFSTVLNAKYAVQQQKAGLVQSKLIDENATAFDVSDLAAADYSDCYSVSGNTITYTDCASATFSFSGTLSVSQTALSFELTMEGTQSGMTMSMTMAGALEYSEIALTGQLSLDVDATANGQSVSYSIDTEYDVVLTDGCATGGTMLIDGNWSAGGSNADVTAYVEFGPACGEAVVR